MTKAITAVTPFDRRFCNREDPPAPGFIPGYFDRSFASCSFITSASLYNVPHEEQKQQQNISI